MSPFNFIFETVHVVKQNTEGAWVSAFMHILSILQWFIQLFAVALPLQPHRKSFGSWGTYPGSAGEQ